MREKSRTKGENETEGDKDERKIKQSSWGICGKREKK